MKKNEKGKKKGGNKVGAGGKGFHEKAFHFYRNLRVPSGMPKGIETMNPYLTKEVQGFVGQFLSKYFSDSRERVYVIGINPGRFGSGLTGVNFTDPVALEKYLGIENALEKKREVSSEFIYNFIESMGGPEKFYGDFFLTAISPLGFTKGGINYNYYDDPAMLAASTPFIIETFNAQLNFGARRDVAILIGTGKNQKYFTELNKKHGFFKKVYAVEHPRFIMQYKRKKLPEYMEKYKQVFLDALKGEEDGK